LSASALVLNIFRSTPTDVIHATQCGNAADVLSFLIALSWVWLSMACACDFSV
jgi:hypothetical protein